MTISNSIVLATNAFGTIGSGLSVSDTALAFTTGHGARFPAVAAGQVLYCTLVNPTNVVEIVKVTAHVAGADSATIVRAANGTSAKAWSAGDRIEARLVSEALVQLQQESPKSIQLSTADAGATYTGTTSPTQLGYVTPAIYAMTVATSNSGTAPTISLDSLSAITVKLDGGGALAAGQMPLNGLYMFNGTDFILLNPLLTPATQAQMEAATSLLSSVTPGRHSYHPGMPKCWVVFTGSTGATLASHNVTSVARLSTGRWRVTFATAFSSANYAYSVTGSDTNRPTMGAGDQVPQTTTTFDISCDVPGSGAPYDPINVSAVFWGDWA